jgi:hypothetical protein
MKTLHNQQYVCPICQKSYFHQEWSEESSKIELACDNCDKTSSVFTIPYNPPWKKYEEGMKHPDSKKQGAFADKFYEVREHEMKTDPKAERWEKSRKEAWQKDKPYYVKKVEEAGI